MCKAGVGLGEAESFQARAFEMSKASRVFNLLEGNVLLAESRCESEGWPQQAEILGQGRGRRDSSFMTNGLCSISSFEIF